MKSSEKKWISILIIITVILIIIKIISVKGANSKIGVSPERLAEFGIDINDEAYKDKKIYEENGDIIIENKNGAKTIQTTKTDGKTDLKELSAEDKSKYEIKDVNVDIQGSRTTVTGKITNNTGKNHKVSVNAKFYSSDNLIKASSNIEIEDLKAGETRKL